MYDSMIAATVFKQDCGGNKKRKGQRAIKCRMQRDNVPTMREGEKTW